MKTQKYHFFKSLNALKILTLMLLSSLFSIGYAQNDSIKKADSLQARKIYLNDSDFNSIITYSARDSIYSNLKTKQVHLYGDAKLNYDGVDMFADYLMIDLEKNEVLATYTVDSTGKITGKPLFIDGSDTLKAASIRYNFDTKKGFIKEAAIRQDEYYLTMEKAKRQPNEEVHFVHGKFTTCNLEEPHYHFGLSKAIMIPDKRIVSGPMNLWIMGVPTPLGLPFAIIPTKTKKKDRKGGFVIPQYSFASAYGMGFQDLGYYFPISDKFQTIVYGTAFNRGSFGLRNYSEYAVRYKFSGNFDIGYSRFRFGFPDSSAINTTTFKWVHNQDPKLNPNWSFAANVNFNSNSTNKQTLNLQNTQYFNNTLNSDIRLGKRFGSLPISADLKLSMRQNSATKIIDLTSPVFNFQTTNRIFPFKKVNKVVGFSYANEIQNRSSFKDVYLKKGQFDSIGRNFRNGITQNINVRATFSIFKNTLRITPSATYRQIYNFQSIVKTLDTANHVLIDTLGKDGFSHALNSSVSLTSTFYSYYRFVGKRKTLLRHVMTPTISFNYAPSIQMGVRSYTDQYGKEVKYSMFERSLYAEGYTKSSGKIVLGVNNTFELKQKSSKDTVTGFKKTRIIDNFFLNTDYDIFKDSMRWNDLSMRLVINPNTYLNITLTAS
ncbi:MAG TPA: putative LPS assembly protein LptD, partial [Fluviicola sp.]|nr:putative LPS assembly protein LptD [Fluviicola sp.]